MGANDMRQTVTWRVTTNGRRCVALTCLEHHASNIDGVTERCIRTEFDSDDECAALRCHRRAGRNRRPRIPQDLSCAVQADCAQPPRRAGDRCRTRRMGRLPVAAACERRRRGVREGSRSSRGGAARRHASLCGRRLQQPCYVRRPLPGAQWCEASAVLSRHSTEHVPDGTERARRVGMFSRRARGGRETVRSRSRVCPLTEPRAAGVLR